jgi:hypothetical protein
MEVSASSSNGVVPLGPESQQAASKALNAAPGANTQAASDINEVSSVDRTGQTSEFKHSSGEGYHSDGEQPSVQMPEDDQASFDSLDITG